MFIHAAKLHGNLVAFLKLRELAEENHRPRPLGVRPLSTGFEKEIASTREKFLERIALLVAMWFVILSLLPRRTHLGIVFLDRFLAKGNADLLESIAHNLLHME